MRTMLGFRLPDEDLRRLDAVRSRLPAEPSRSQVARLALRRGLADLERGGGAPCACGCGDGSHRRPGKGAADGR